MVSLSLVPQELAQEHLQYAQDMAMEADAQVAARILTLEAEHKDVCKVSLLQTELKEAVELLKIENRNLQEKLQHETHLKEELERVSSDPQQGSVFLRKACGLCAQGGEGVS